MVCCLCCAYDANAILLEEEVSELSISILLAASQWRSHWPCSLTVPILFKSWSPRWSQSRMKTKKWWEHANTPTPTLCLFLDPKRTNCVVPSPSRFLCVPLRTTSWRSCRQAILKLSILSLKRSTVQVDPKSVRADEQCDSPKKTAIHVSYHKKGACVQNMRSRLRFSMARIHFMLFVSTPMNRIQTLNQYTEKVDARSNELNCIYQARSRLQRPTSEAGSNEWTEYSINKGVATYCLVLSSTSCCCANETVII